MPLTIEKALAILGIKDVYDPKNPPKMKFIQKKFYQLSLLHHPDRPGGDNIIQQKITEAYKFIGDYIDKNIDVKDDSDEEFARQMYRNFNFNNIKENLSSFTIKIDNNLSFCWDTILTNHYGPPIDRKTNRKHWKHCKYSDDSLNTGDISITKWHIPKKDKQSKILIQSNSSANLLPAHFVSEQLPKLLTEGNELASLKPVECQNPGLYPCKKCDYKFNKKSQLQAHAKKCHKLIEANPGAITSSFDIPAPFYVLPPTPTVQETFKCFICPDTFYKQGEWDEHAKSVHDIKCNLCCETFLTNSDLNKHIEADHRAISDADIPLLECDYCSFTAKLNRAMKTHVQNTHSFKCSLCECNYTSKAEFNVHISRIHNKKSQVILKKLLACNDCNFTSSQKKVLDDHVLKKHSLPIISTTIYCEFCPFSTNKKSKLMQHTATSHAHSSLKCDHCAFSSSSQFALDLHVVREHDPTEPDSLDHSQPSTTKCRQSPLNYKQCVVACQTEDDLKLHNYPTHAFYQQEKPQLHSCTLCGITFSIEHDLNSHIQRRHTQHTLTLTMRTSENP